MINDNNTQGRRHEIFVVGTGSWASKPTYDLPPKFSFSSDFVHFILRMLENAKF